MPSFHSVPPRRARPRCEALESRELLSGDLLVPPALPSAARTLTGQVGLGDPPGLYRVDVPAAGRLEVNVGSPASGLSLHLYGPDGRSLADSFGQPGVGTDAHF